MIESIDKYVDKFYEALTGHPKMGLLLIMLCLLVWLTGIIFNWKWTYERGAFWANFLQYFIPESYFRLIVGIIISIALIACIALIIFF